MESRVPVLVVGATGRQGAAVCEALASTGAFNIYGTTRTVPNAKLADMGVTAVAFKFGDAASIEQALTESAAKKVFFVTDFFGAAGKKKQKEVEHGTIIIDACVKAGVEHVVFSSVADADTCPDNIEHFKSKLQIEEYIKNSSLSYSILRPVAYLDNFNDPANFNPMKKGYLKFLTKPDTKVKFVACKDIGKAAAEMIANSSNWSGTTLDCASCELSGAEAAEILAEVSGVPCKYSSVLPRFVLRFLNSDIEKMLSFFESTGFSSSVENFIKVIPSAMGAKEFFRTLGKWSNGEEFGVEPAKPEPITAEAIKLKVQGLFGHKMFLFTSALTAGITAGIAVLFAVKPMASRKLIK